LKIIKSLIIIVAMAAMASGATSAVFSDQETISGNTFATGTLDLELNNLVGKPFEVTGAYPGYISPWAHMDLSNVGSLPFESYLWLNHTSDSPGLYAALKIDLHDSGADLVCGNGDDTSIYSGLLSGITGPGLRTQTSDNYFAAVGTPGNDNIIPRSAQRVCQRLELPSTASDALQGKTTAFSEIVKAEQDDD